MSMVRFPGWTRLSGGLEVLVSRLLLTFMEVCFSVSLLFFHINIVAAPGSQNGFDNSGRYGSINWQQGDTVSQTVEAIRALAARYAPDTDVVTAIAILNEPFGPSLDINQIKKFNYDGWGTIRDYNPDTAVVIHDAFEGVGYWNGFMGPGAGVNNVMLDTHVYQIFNQEQVSLDYNGHVSQACGFASQLSGTDKWTIVGEWTGATTDCALWLNGRNKGARYDGSISGSSYVGDCGPFRSGSVSALSQDAKDGMSRFIRAQIQAFEAKTGWLFWTWHTEGAPGWDLQDLLANGLFPQPIVGSGC
jgi:glucan 1,3-beta-glucosidase